MQPKAAALLWYLLTATTRIQGFVAGKSWDDYAADILLRSGSSGSSRSPARR